MDGLRNVLTRLQQQGAALGHFNVADLVLLKAVVAAAVPARVPVIVGASEGERDFWGTYELAARAIAAGINIIHINTEPRVAWRRSLEGSLTSQPNEIVPYKILPPVVESVKQVVSSRLKLFNAQLTSGENAFINWAMSATHSRTLGEQMTDTALAL